MVGEVSAPFGPYYVLHRESVTTDIRDRLSGLGKRLKEKKEGKAPAEDAMTASPAESAVPVSEAAAERDTRMSQEALEAALAAFGWSVPASGSAGEISLPESAETFPAAEAPGEEVLPETPAEPAPAAEELPAEEAPLPAAAAKAEQTSVFDAISEEQAAEAAAAEAARAEEAARTDMKELLGGMSQEILSEVFSPEERSELERDETHVFTKEDIDNLAEREDKEEKKRRERRQATTVLRPARKDKPAEPKKEKTAVRPVKEKPAPEYTARDYRPIRRRRNYRTGLRGGLMYFGFVICVSAILASLAWLAADDVLSLNKDFKEAQIYVGEEQSIEQVSAELYNKGIIKYRRLFELIAKFTNAETKIDPGVYTISTKLDYNAMIHAMRQVDSVPEERPTVTVMIPEGKTLKQTFQILAEHGVCPYETLLECAANHEFKYSFLSDIPYGDDNRLEGYLFPDTYEFFASSDPEDAIDKFLSNFDSKMNADLRQKVEDSGYSLREILTVASLIEMEAGSDSERATIASVIYNRLSSSYYPYLQIDAAIQYALGEHKETLTNADLEIDSPYNTYKYTGLPPGPISNPGMASIRAALSPESTGYYFYALNKSGTHNFFSSMSQFENFVNSSEFGG